MLSPRSAMAPKAAERNVPSPSWRSLSMPILFRREDASSACDDTVPKVALLVTDLVRRLRSSVQPAPDFFPPALLVVADSSAAGAPAWCPRKPVKTDLRRDLPESESELRRG